MTTARVNRVSLTARVIPTLKKALETESREHGQTTSNYVESILLNRGQAVSDDDATSLDFQQQLEELHAQNEALKEKLETYIPEDDLIQEQEDAVYRKRQYQARIDELTAHIERLSEDQHNQTISTDEYDAIVLSKSTVESANQALEIQVNDLIEQLQEARQYDEEKDHLRIKFLQLQETEKFLRITNEDLEEKIEQLKEEVEINEGAMDQLVLMNEETKEKYSAQIIALEQPLQAFYNTGYDVEEIDTLGDEIEMLHTRIEELEEQTIETDKLHKAEITSLNELIETLELEIEDIEVIDPDYVEDLKQSIANYKTQIAQLEEQLIQGEDALYLDLTPEQALEVAGYFGKLRTIYEGRSDEELVLGALYCGVRNERAFLRKLLGDYFEK